MTTSGEIVEAAKNDPTLAYMIVDRHVLDVKPVDGLAAVHHRAPAPAMASREVMNRAYGRAAETKDINITGEIHIESLSDRQLFALLTRIDGAIEGARRDGGEPAEIDGIEPVGGHQRGWPCDVDVRPRGAAGKDTSRSDLA